MATPGGTLAGWMQPKALGHSHLASYKASSTSHNPSSICVSNRLTFLTY